MIGFRGWSVQEAGGSTLLAKSAAEATWFAVRPMAAAVNSTNEQSSHYGPPANSPAAEAWRYISKLSLVFLEPSNVRK
jgi:hypothetical protein